MPQIIAAENERMTWPPRKNNASSARKTVVAVMMVRGRTALTDMSMISAVDRRLYLRITSRMRSSTTTVSFSE